MAETNDAVDKFTKMAAQLDRNSDGAFGGAFVVIPPKEGGDTLETLILDSRQDATQFWILLKTKCETEIALLDQKQRSTGAFGGRR